jgi:hypothetical protein
MEKDPRRRFHDAAEFEEALEHQRWRLGPRESTPPPGTSTPPPSPAPGRGSRDARADSAYQRSLAAYRDGAEEAAKRFLVETLAEDANHPGARALLEQLDPRMLANATRPPVPQATSLPPTLVASQPSGSPTVVRRDHAGTAWWKRHLPQQYRLAAAGVASLVVLAGIVMVVIRLSGWWASGRTLTITRPTGGTILAKSITCGTLGSDCLATLANGETIELQAQADPDFVFSGYLGDCAPAGRTTMTAARTCGATFTPVPKGAAASVSRALTITPPKGGTVMAAGITCGSLGTVCQTEYPNGTEVKLNVQADPEFTFSRYTGACAPDGRTVMTEARTCGATFIPMVAGSPGGGGGAGSGLPTRKPRGGASEAPPPPSSLPPPPPGVIAGGATGDKPGSESVAPPPTNAPSNVPPTGVLVPVPPPPDPVVTAKAAIEDVIKQYCAAHDLLDLKALRVVYPKAQESMRRQFDDYKTMECTLASPPEFSELDAVGGSATVQVGIKQVVKYKIGKDAVVNWATTLMLVRPEPRGKWFIDDAINKPRK